MNVYKVLLVLNSLLSTNLSMCTLSFFHGATKESAEQSARQFADDAVEKYGATYLARVEALAKAREKKSKKKDG